MLKLLCTAEFDDFWEDKINQIVSMKRVGFSLDKNPASRMKSEQLIETLQGQDIFIVGYERVTKEVLEKCPDIKLILSVRDGPEENIDIEECTERGIPVLFSAGRCARSVPENTFFLMMALAKPIFAANRVMRTVGWTKESDMLLRRINEEITELSGKTLGIVGLGRNGLGLAVRALAFGMKVIGYDPYVEKNKMNNMGITVCELDDLMRQSDYVSLMARVTPETRGLIGERELSLMKATASLINKARAALLDTNALISILREGKIKSAALDVFEQEPLAKDSPLYDICESKLLITPHTAGLSKERIIYQSEKLHDFLYGYLRGFVPETFCNRKVLETEAFKTRGGLLFGIIK